MILGLTGFSGAGKSTVAALLKENNFYHLDCDWVVHHIVYTDPNVLSALADAFGNQVLENGALNRPALRQCTMGNPDALKKLNQTVMPFILGHIDALLTAHRGENIIIDAPLLFESGLDQKCDYILAVVAPKEAALERIIARDHLSPTDAEKRLSSQHSASYYTEKSDFTISNNGEPQALKEQVDALLRKLNDQTL